MTEAPGVPGQETMAESLPTYGFPPLFMATWLATLPRGRPRNLGVEATRLLAGRAPPPVALGTEHVPPAGTPFVLAMNHYERPGLNVWWGAMWVSAILWRARGEQPPVRWLVADRIYGYRVAGLRIPDAAMAWLLRRVARRYGALPVARDSEARDSRARALRLAGSALLGAEARPVGITPEAGRGGGTKLVPPEPNAGLAIAWLARRGIPVLPVGIFEAAVPHSRPDDPGLPALTARVGPPLSLPWPRPGEPRARREALGETVMRAIAAQLPPALRGPYGPPGSPPDGER